MIEWISRVGALLAAGTPVVRMVVAGVRGSAPREPGASLLYWGDASGRLCSFGSVGGGRLEDQSMEIARYLLDAAPSTAPGLPRERRRIQRFTLGASLGQCCGGVVDMYWERFDHPSQAEALLRQGGAGCGGDGSECLRYCVIDASEREWLLGADEAQRENLPGAAFDGRAGVLRSGATAYFVERLVDDASALWIYGAGHVGRALVHVLADLPFCISWVDSRPEMLAQAMAALPPARRDRIAAHADEPDALCAGAPERALHLVMTHCHDQDLRICEALLARGDFGFLGVIGSQTKAARFRHRLLARGHAPGMVARMSCPIGIDGIHDKRPAAIAVAVAGQLLQQRTLADRWAVPRAAPRRQAAGTAAARHG